MSSSLDVRWRFRAMAPGEMNHDPMEREFFEGEALNTRLARESIQNSLDAAIQGSNGPVRMRFSMAGISHPLPAEAAAKYFVGLDEHLACIPDMDDEIDASVRKGELSKSGVPYLVIEDAGTVGLTGDWSKFDDPADGTAQVNNFFWFFRNIGRSGKGASANGSWGLGKWVFPDASRVSSYIAVTKRSDDHETLLIGQSILNKHTIGGDRFAPYGYFGEENEEGLQLPLRLSEPGHRKLIEECIADFGLSLRDDPGLSVIIPFPRLAREEEEGVTKEQILGAIIHNYFFPLIRGRLEVTVEVEDGEPVILNADTIDQVLVGLDLQDTRKRSAESYRKLFVMCRAGISLTDDDYRRLDRLPGNASDDPARAALVELRPRFEANEMLAFRIGSTVQRKGCQPEPSGYRLYLQRDESLSEGHDYYVRGTLSISEMDNIKGHRARALLVVDENEQLAALLRDSEPPAHTRWGPRARRIFSRWVTPSRRVSDVCNTASRLLGVLESAPEGVQKDAFADIFFWDGGERPVNRGSGISEGKQNSNVPVNPPPLRREFAVTRIESGFRVTLADGVEDPPVRARLQVAYEIPRGNPLKNYHTEDFRLHGRGEKLNLQLGGCQFRPGTSGNEVLLEIDNPDEFEFTVTGFDPLRDVHVRVESVFAANGEGDDANP